MTDSFTHSVPGIRDGNQMVVGGRKLVEKLLQDHWKIMIVMLVPGDNMKFYSRSFSLKLSFPKT